MLIITSEDNFWESKISLKYLGRIHIKQKNELKIVQLHIASKVLKIIKLVFFTLNMLFKRLDYCIIVVDMR